MAIFFSLFIAENCFKRVNTAESRGLSGATPSTHTQGWPERKYRLVMDKNSEEWTKNVQCKSGGNLQSNS